MCVFVCLYVEPVLRSKEYVWSGIKTGSVLCLKCRVYYIFYWGVSFFEDVPPVEFMYFVLVVVTRMPGESCRRRFRSLLLCCCTCVTYFER